MDWPGEIGEKIKTNICDTTTCMHLRKYFTFSGVAICLLSVNISFVTRNICVGSLVYFCFVLI